MVMMVEKLFFLLFCNETRISNKFFDFGFWFYCVLVCEGGKSKSLFKDGMKWNGKTKGWL
jgi:hypothetical protein